MSCALYACAQHDNERFMHSTNNSNKEIRLHDNAPLSSVKNCKLHSDKKKSVVNVNGCLHINNYKLSVQSAENILFQPRERA